MNVNKSKFKIGDEVKIKYFTKKEYLENKKLLLDDTLDDYTGYFNYYLQYKHIGLIVTNIFPKDLLIYNKTFIECSDKNSGKKLDIPENFLIKSKSLLDKLDRLEELLVNS